VVALTFTAAWLIVRLPEPGAMILDVMISLPLVFPGIVLGITILIEFLRLPMIPIYGTSGFWVFAFLIRFMPYGMRFWPRGILAIHRELEECGRTCGAGASRCCDASFATRFAVGCGAWLLRVLHTVRDLSLAVLLAGPGGQSLPSSFSTLDKVNTGTRRACGRAGGRGHCARRCHDVAQPANRQRRHVIGGRNPGTVFRDDISPGFAKGSNQATGVSTRIGKSRNCYNQLPKQWSTEKCSKSLCRK